MERSDLGLTGDPEVLLARLAERREAVPPPHSHHGPSQSVREATYKGHHIVVRTTYTVEVDGVAVEGHLAVTNDGQVHYHAVPNLGFGSAIELVKMLIDAFPDDFAGPDDAPGQDPGHGPGEGHSPEHGHIREV